MPSSNFSFLTCLQISQEVGQVVWYSHLFKIFHSLLWSTQSKAVVNEAEVDVFLKFSCFFYDPTDVGNLISGSSDFSKSSLNIWKFSVHVLLKHSLENLEHYFARVWDECNCAWVWISLALPFFGIGMKTALVQSCGHCRVFQICWHIECNTFTESSFRIWNSSPGILSPTLWQPLPLWVWQSRP